MAAGLDFSIIENKYLQGFSVVDKNIDKPWGGYFVIDTAHIRDFIIAFFPSLAKELMNVHQNLSPKLLVVKPKQRLSWQYHFRREEFWRVLDGPVAVAMSYTDEQPQSPQTYQKGDLIHLPSSVRHRLIGLEDVGVVAEIWKHTHPKQLSNEEDIVRVQDDYGR